jgi:hypothetical protein
MIDRMPIGIGDVARVFTSAANRSKRHGVDT